MGDLGDLAELARLGRAARSAPASSRSTRCTRPCPARPTDPSPYRPSSRRFPDPVHLRIEDVPEYAYADARRTRLDELLQRAGALRDEVLRRRRR